VRAEFLEAHDRRVAHLIQVCAALDRPETVAREYRGLHKAAAATRCRDLTIITADGEPPPKLLVPEGPAVAIRSVRDWLLAPGTRSA
jgi:hypothetical protein